jgi:GTP-binding protein HflX
LLALNKIDRPGADRDAARSPTRPVALSALTGEGLDTLVAAIDEALPFDPVVEARFRFPLGEGDRLPLLHEFGRVVDVRYGECACDVDARVPESLKRRLARYLIS